MRTERDSLGEITLGDDEFYGIQTARARDNFSLNYRCTSYELIRAMVLVKKAAAMTYQSYATSDHERSVYEAIGGACDEVLGMHNLERLFVVDALQGGAGTSTNMNVNEVLANLALRRMGLPLGSYTVIHPLDHVNRGQSTNDVYPTSLRIAAIMKLRRLSEECAKLQERLQACEHAWDGVVKLGRTELMDAVATTLGSEFGAYAQALGRDRWRLYKVEERLRQINLGGTAIGSSEASERQYRYGVYERLRELTAIGLAASEYPMDITQNNDVFVEASGLIKALAVNMAKIAGDIRLMNSGPSGGLGEIRVGAVQMGSTIMPGKVNPVIAEMAIQASIKVQSNDMTIACAASRGEFELNAFLPLIADALLESLGLMERAVYLFRTRCVDRIEPNVERCASLLAGSSAYAARYTALLGYETVERVVREHGAGAERVLRQLAEGRSGV